MADSQEISCSVMVSDRTVERWSGGAVGADADAALQSRHVLGCYVFNSN